MEIAEVNIGPKGEPRKKFSASVLKRAEAYLGDKGIRIDQLTDEQRERVLTFIRSKRVMKWWLAIAILTFLAVVLLGAKLGPLSAKLMSGLIPDTVSVETEDGPTRPVKVSQEDRETIESYGTLCALMGGALATLACTAISVLVGVVGNVFTIREARKTFDAFLPLVGTAS